MVRKNKYAGTFDVSVGPEGQEIVKFIKLAQNVSSSFFI